jgi:hypothetical protein
MLYIKLNSILLNHVSIQTLYNYKTIMNLTVNRSLSNDVLPFVFHLPSYLPTFHLRRPYGHLPCVLLPYPYLHPCGRRLRGDGGEPP